MNQAFRDWEHVLRIAGLFAAGLLLFLILKTILLPEGFGLYGHYRAGAIDDNAVNPLQHAGQRACASCHEETATERERGKHKSVSCEGCHGPLAQHAAKPSASAAKRPEGRSLCLNCHSMNVARPAAFPQVSPEEHAPEGSCLDCHAPHNPMGD